MNLIVSAPAWLSTILLVVLAIAALEDAFRLRISNITCAAVFVGALIAMVLHGLSPSLWQNALVCIAILAIGTPAFTAGWLGGGDIKLLAAIGLWLDLQAAAGLIAAVFIAGGVLGLIYIAARRVTRPHARSPKDYARVPYGLAIVFGAIFIFGIQLTERRPTNPFLEHMRALQQQQALRAG
jgi:prepilin peptidase CpaA